MNNDATEAALGLLGLSPSNLPPPQLIPLKRKQSSASISAPTTDDNSTEAIKCICGFTYDDGFSIACDDCSRWCHAACFDIVEGEVPEEWRCWECVPRAVDRERAVKLQKSRQKQAQDQMEIEKQRRRASPGVDRKHRRASAAAIEGGNSKRKRRPSINAPPPLTEDEHVDIDEPWTHSYVHVTQDIVPHQDTRDKLRRQAQHWRGVTALSPSSPYDTTPIRIPPETLQLPSQTTIHPLPNSSFSHPTLSLNTNPSVRPPSYAMHTTNPIPSAQLITPFTSTIIPSSTYLSDPLNAYAHLGMPKPFVHLIGSPLDLTLDSRITGDKGRFVRSGCRPNAVLRPVLCPRTKTESISETLSFGVFALRDLKANEEVVLGWEWDDGNAVHSLPALIQTPQMFPPGCRTPNFHSPDQLEHLRNQMSNILHALSSTFTTCACGSKAKDCALTQMAAFVDGEVATSGESSKHVDLGPLVGVQRGFKTREKVPYSGGMSGVEMCAAGGGNLETPTVNVSSATTPRKSKNRDRKGKARAMEMEGGDDGEYESGSSLTSGQENSGFKRSAKKRSRRLTIDTIPPEHTPPLRWHPRPPEPREDEGGGLEEEAEGDVDADAMEVEEEDKMPPKMRKRWIHRSSEALKDLQGSSESPGESVVSLGSVVSGGVGLGIRVDESGNGTGAGGGEEKSDRMEIDDIPADAKDMPPPPMPAALDPTTISSLSWIPDATIRTSLSFEAREGIATSPSTSFARLSLLSPVIPGPASSSPQIIESFVTVSTPSPPQEGAVTAATNEDTLAISGSTDIVPRVPAIDSPLPIPVRDESDSSFTEPEPKVRFASPACVDLPSSLERRLASTDDESPESPPLPSIDDHPILFDPSRSPVSLPSAESHEDVPEVSQPPVESLPRSISPPPPQPKVKLSLKDFALRKKKQREEEMAKTVASPTNMHSALESESPLNGVNGDDVEMSSGDDSRRASAHDHPRDHPPSPDNQVLPRDDEPRMTNGTHLEPDRTDDQDQLTIKPYQLLSEPTLVLDTAPLPTPSLLRPRSTSPRLSNGNDKINDLDSSSLKAKVELIEQPIPNGVSAAERKQLDVSPSPPEPPPPPLNGTAKTYSRDTPDQPQSLPQAQQQQSHWTPSPPTPDFSDHSRRPSHEDGEIPSNTCDTPPPLLKQKHVTTFVPRSHTPPTQPRSFHISPSSPSVSTPSPAATVVRRPSQPPQPQVYHRPAATQFQSSASPALGPATQSARPLPSGPRALRVGNHIGLGHQPAYTPPNRSFSGPQFIPRGPSADRERMDWGDRDRAWPGQPRSRGRGGSSGAGWAR